MNETAEKQIEKRKGNTRVERVVLAVPVEDLNRPLASAAGYELSKKVRDRVLAYDGEVAKITAQIVELGKHGINKLRAEQAAAIVAAAKADKPLPTVAVDNDKVCGNDLGRVIATQVSALKAEARRICTEAAKVTVPAVRDYVKAASRFVDTMGDAELEAYNRFGLAHVGSPLVGQLREALRITAERNERTASADTSLSPRQQMQGLL